MSQQNREIEARVREQVAREQHVEGLRTLRRAAVEGVMRRVESPDGAGRLAPERRAALLGALGDPARAREWRLAPLDPARVDPRVGVGGGIMERTYRAPSAASVLVGPGEDAPAGARMEEAASLEALVDGQLSNYRNMKRSAELLREWGTLEPADEGRPLPKLPTERADWITLRARHELGELRRRSPGIFTDEFQAQVEQVLLRGDPNEASEYEVVSVKVPRGPEGGAPRIRLELHRWPNVSPYPDATDSGARAPKGQPVIAKRQSLRQFARNVAHVWQLRERFAGGRTDVEAVEEMVQPTLQRLV